MWTEYVIDATMGVRDGMLCFCPVERGADGEIENIVTGMNYLSDAPPRDGKLIAVVHADGQPAVEEWCAENKALLDVLFARASDGSPEGEKPKALSAKHESAVPKGGAQQPAHLTGRDSDGRQN